MSNTHPQPRQFTPNNRHPNSQNPRQRASMFPVRETNFVPRINDGGFNPSRIRNNQNSSNYPNNQNSNFYYNPNNNSSNPTSNTNSSVTINPSAIISNNNINQTNSVNTNLSNKNDNNNNSNNNSNNNNSNVNNTDNNNITDSNIATQNNDNNNEESRSPLQCPLCTENKFTFHSECVFHIVMTHGYQNCIKKNIENNCQCKYCGKLLSNDNEIIVQHMFDYHREDFFKTIIESKTGNHKRLLRLRNYLTKVLTVKEEPRVIRKQIDEKQIANYNDEDDDDYVNFIASSIHLNGLSSHDKVEIKSVQPISNPGPQPQTEVIDHNFWVKLNNIAERLRNSGHIETNENRYFCYICNKDFDSHVKLLSHCWNKHQNTK